MRTLTQSEVGEFYPGVCLAPDPDPDPDPEPDPPPDQDPN